jgi:hypothetical protein
MAIIMTYDWDIIKTEYLQGYINEKGKLKLPTLKELCQRHGCSISTIRHQSSECKWKDQRKQFKEERVERIHEKKLDVLINEAAKFDSKSLKTATIGVDEGLERLKDKSLSTHNYMKISIAIMNFQKVGLLALGEPTERVKNDNKQEVILDDSFKDPDIKADLSSLYEQWDKKTNKSSGSGKD